MTQSSSTSAWLGRIGPSDDARRDAEAFLQRVRQHELFAPGRAVVVARAPGRLDVMGGIADYSGSVVLEWPLADATCAAVQRDPNPTLKIVSEHRSFDLSVRELARLDYGSARALFASDPFTHWAAYVAGVFVVLARERGVEFTDGARMLIASTVPEGKGVASSAALEVAAMMAICAAYEITIEPRDVAILCQKVENYVAGAPCGVMDQMTSVLGDSGRLLSLLCRPADVQGHVELPGELALWGIDSGVRHAVSGADYGTVRAAAFMGLRILAGLGVRADYLASVTPDAFAAVASRIPERMTGREFLEQYERTSDPVTTIDPDREYPVHAATAHPIHEHARVQEFARLLQDAARGSPLAARSEDTGQQLGQLMYASHASYSACGLGTDHTDALVTFVRRDGPRSGLYGAKITGGGSGGTVAILGRSDAGPLVQAIAARYARRWGHAAHVFSDSSAGAATVGVISLEL